MRGSITRARGRSLTPAHGLILRRLTRMRKPSKDGPGRVDILAG
jgi:hypothetical protein